MLKLKNIDSGFYVGGMKPHQLRESQEKNRNTRKFPGAAKKYTTCQFLAEPHTSLQIVPRSRVGRVLSCFSPKPYLPTSARIGTVRMAAARLRRA